MMECTGYFSSKSQRLPMPVGLMIDSNQRGSAILRPILHDGCKVKFTPFCREFEALSGEQLCLAATSRGITSGMADAFFLADHRDMIPDDEVAGMYLVFPETRLVNSEGIVFLPCIYKVSGIWRGVNFYRLDDLWRGHGRLVSCGC